MNQKQTIAACRPVKGPFIFDTVGGGMDEQVGWIIDAEGRYLAEAVKEDEEGRYVYSARARNEALAKIVSRANVYEGLVVALRNTINALKACDEGRDFLASHAIGKAALKEAEGK